MTGRRSFRERTPLSQTEKCALDLDWSLSLNFVVADAVRQPLALLGGKEFEVVICRLQSKRRTGSGWDGVGVGRFG